MALDESDFSMLDRLLNDIATALERIATALESAAGLEKE